MKIEKGIPRPVRQNMSGYFSKMEIGDSIFISEQDVGRDGIEAAIRNARSWAFSSGKNVSARRMDGGVRIWRTV